MLELLSLFSLLPPALASTLSARQSSLASCLSSLSPITSSSSSYSNATTGYNLRIPLAPAAIVYPTSPQQVADAVLCAASAGVNVTARGGGHSYAAAGLGGSNGSLVIDMSAFDTITYNSDGTVDVGAGSRLGNVAMTLNDHGRATPHGTCAQVGIGGHASYGGFGLASRQWGLTIDQITSLDVVLANGSIITNLTASTDPDLLWALSGAAPNFGIVTNFRLKTYEAPTSAINFYYNYEAGALNASEGAAVFAAYQVFGNTSAPKELGISITMGNGGTLEISGVYYGTEAAFNATIEELVKDLPGGYTTTIEALTWLESLDALNGTPTGNIQLNVTGVADSHDDFYAKSLITPEGTYISDGALNAFFNYMWTTSTSTSWFVEVNLYGGAGSVINSLTLDDNAFAHRSGLLTFQIYASSQGNVPPFPDEGITFIQGIYDSLVNPMKTSWGSSYGAYTNYADPLLSPSDVQALYWGAQYARLAALRTKYDPQAVFRNPQSIVGSSGD